MKQKHILAVALALGLIVASPADAAALLHLQMGDQAATLKHPLTVVRERTMIAADDAAAILHGEAKVVDRILRFAVGNESLLFPIGGKEVEDGRKVKGIDPGAVKIGDQVYLPFRWLMERFGLRVGWDARTQTVMIQRQGEEQMFASLEMASLSKAEQDFVEQVKKEKGIHQRGDLYVIARGPSPNPGYGLTIVEQKRGWEELTVFVRLTKPQPGKMYPQVISYPILVGRATLPPYTTIRFVDADTGKPLFQEK